MTIVNAKEERCKVDVFFDAVASVQKAFVDGEFFVWFGTVGVFCSREQAKTLLERETLISFENGEGGSAKLLSKPFPVEADQELDAPHEFYFVGTSPLLDLRSSGERRLLA